MNSIILKRGLSMCLILLCSVALAQTPQRLRVPTDDAVAGAKLVIAEFYKQDYAAAKSRPQKQALAKKLLEDGLKTRDDGATMFALLTVARKIAVGIGDVESAVQAAEVIGAEFDVDVVQQRIDVLTEVAPQASTPGDQLTIARYLGRDLRALLKARRYEAAPPVIELAQAAASKANDADLVKQWQRRADHFALAMKSWPQAQAALKALESKPGDSAANAVAGKFACFLEEDWPQGLPMLALASDKALQALAERELKGAASDAERLALADAWYDLGQQQTDSAKGAVDRHAAKLYRECLPLFKGPSLQRVQARLAELDKTSRVVKNEWIEILDLVEISKRPGEPWKREGLAIVAPGVENCKSFHLPVVLEGAYELRIRALRIGGSEVLSVGLSSSANRVLYALNAYQGRASGLHLLNNQGADSNASKTAPAPIRDGVPYLLGLQVEPSGEQVAITATLDDQRYSQWTGKRAELSMAGPPVQPLTLGACNAAIAIMSVQLKVKSGAAWMVD